jgi:hypothetical protein
MKLPTICLECAKPASTPVYIVTYFGHQFALCERHLNYFHDCHATDEAMALYFALKQQQLPVRLEHHDHGFKRVDIAIPGKLHIELDDIVNDDKKRAPGDGQHDDYNLNHGIATIHISSALVNNKTSFDAAVEKLSGICRSYAQLGKTG